ncbi:hypothetical protein B0H10DRAFT_2014546 [Mycena sp. CBHHK59/15]|nr:hypothetical protein B0H10DRAFT_2014546 [Mycena sp. CBHHK59/15]
MASSLKAGHPEYRRSLGERGLVLRWSTAADKAGCVLLSRKGERIRCELVRPFLIYSLCHWLTKPEQTEHFIDSYVDNMRAQAGGENERVVALVYFLSAEFAFHRNAMCLPVGKAQIVACKSAYRRGATTEGTMTALFEMVHARAYATGCAFLITSGIPTYYRTHGCEYALKLGRGLVTHTATPYTLRRATSADLPALERLQQLRWLLGERPSPSATAEAYPDTPSTQTAAVHVHPLLWDGDEDASAISLTLARELIKAVDDMLAPAKCV